MGGQGDFVGARPVRLCIPLELLREEAADEEGEGLPYLLMADSPAEGMFGQRKQHIGAFAVFHKIIEEEVMQLVASQNAFRLLRTGQQLGGDRRVL